MFFIEFHIADSSYAQQLWWKLLLLMYLLPLFSSLELIVVYQKSSSLLDSNNFLNLSGDTNSLLELHYCDYSEAENCISSYKNALLVLDLTDRVETQFLILEYCKEWNTPHLVLENKLNYFDELTFSVTPSSSDKIKAILAVLRYFGWQKGLVIYEEIEESPKAEFENYSAGFNYLTIESGSSIEELVNRIITPLGTTMYYVFMRSSGSYKLQFELSDNKLLVEGNGIVLDQNSGYQCIINGALIVTVKGQELSTSEDEYFNNVLESFMLYLLEHVKTESKKEILFQLNSLLSTNFNFSVVNIQDGERVVVGEIIDQEFSLLTNIAFPGDTQETPKSAKKILLLSIEAGSTNPTGAPVYVGKIGGLGSYAACDAINEGSSGLLDNFQLELFNFDCGATIYNATFANPCYLKDSGKFGIAHVAAAGSGMAIGSMKSFQQLNLTFPIVSASNGDVSLSSTANFPMYMRVSVSNSYTFTLIPIFVRALGWEKCAILYQNDTWGKSGYYYFNQSTYNHDLALINPESSRAIPPSLDRDGVKKYSYILQEIINSKARFLVFIVLEPSAYYILEEFYNLGLRSGDLILLTAANELLSFSGYDNAFKYELLEIAVPFLAIYGRSWVEPVASKVKSLLAKSYDNQISPYSCYYFDAIYLIAHALDYMIDRGLDYTDPDKLQKIMRNQQFYGCTGKVLIEKNTNDRIMESLNIEVNSQNNGNVTTFYMGLFKPYSTQIIEITKPLIYADGSTIKPSDLRDTNYKCPFPNKSIKTFEKGRALVFGICFGVALISLIITVYIWKRWWKISIEPLTAKEEISTQDFIVGATIVIEFFQFSSMGPNFSPINSTLAEVSYAFSLSLISILKLENGIFWIVVDSVFGAIILWVILCLVVLLRLDEKFQTVSMFRYLDILADYLMPILGNLCFIPFISICLDIFLCDQSIGDNFTDSFLAQDCYYFCWTGEHLAYAILSVFALIAYEPLAVFCRPLWQELQPLLHVKAVPLFLMVKTIVQITLIVMNKTVKRAQSTLHGVLFLLVMVLYIIFLFKFKPYNYPRFSLWQALVLIGVVWLALLSIITQSLGGNELLLTFILILGLIIIALIGIYVQRKKYPSLLFRKKGHDTSTLFKFAFTFGKLSQKALTKISPSVLSKSSAQKVESQSS
ncbi:unnamed protein product [Blepharisma stoltei]|uniref:Receptor ligand binding region domain-containing protein n=1 Tax=Blepharisma stoltei TaxID=1481888 RepID=A0AAU9KBG3_9CILI|nr:unnamed protein product [Blepharisma stoltei]